MKVYLSIHLNTRIVYASGYKNYAFISYKSKTKYKEHMARFFYLSNKGLLSAYNIFIALSRRVEMVLRMVRSSL